LDGLQGVTSITAAKGWQRASPPRCPKTVEATVKPPQDAGEPAAQGFSPGDFRDRKEIQAWANNIAPTFEASADAGAPCHAADRAAWTAPFGFPDS